MKPKKNKKGLKCNRCDTYNFPDDIAKTNKIPEHIRWKAHMYFLERRSYLEGVEDLIDEAFTLDEIEKIFKSEFVINVTTNKKEYIINGEITSYNFNPHINR